MTSNSDYRLAASQIPSPAAPPAARAPERINGVAFDELPVGAVVEVETGHSTYTLENRGDGKALISGHPTYCPEPVLVELHGSVGPSMLKMWLIEPGLKLEFRHPVFGVIRTSRVRSVRQLKVGAPS
jgi:hypothetical protein